MKKRRDYDLHKTYWIAWHTGRQGRNIYYVMCIVDIFPDRPAYDDDYIWGPDNEFSLQPWFALHPNEIISVGEFEQRFNTTVPLDRVKQY